MFIMQVLTSQLHFLVNRNAELAFPSLFWPVNCTKIGHVALLGGPSINFLFYDVGKNLWPRHRIGNKIRIEIVTKYTKNFT